MKFNTTNRQKFQKNLLNIFIIYLSLSSVLSLKAKIKPEAEIENEFEQELEKQVEAESKNIENMFNEFNFMELGSRFRNETKSNQNIKVEDTKDSKLDLTGYFAVSNLLFDNQYYFPLSISKSKNTVDFKNDEIDNFIVNKQFPSAEDKDIKNKYMFFFRFKNGIVYFTDTNASMNVLGSLKPVKASNNYYINRNVNVNETCFNVYDNDDMTWNLCAGDMEIKRKWLCSLEKFTLSYMEDFCLSLSDNKKAGNSKDNYITNNPPKDDKIKANSANEDTTKKIQNLLIIPTESRKCNNNWNYLENGKDWECTCSDGIQQSPIDLPSMSDAEESKIKPLFMYENILPISKESSMDGILVENEPVKIFHKNGAVRILHNYMGKIIDNKGAVFHGEEILFHTPSEHTIEGKKFDLEVQVIHYGKSKGDIAKQVILSFLFYESPGIFNKFFEKLDYYNLPNEIDTYTDLKQKLFIPEILYKNEDFDITGMHDFSFYSYEGSLTFPPCTERTTYYVAANPIPLSSTVIGLFKEALRKPDHISHEGKIVKSYEGYKLNNRVIQPLNGRKIHYHKVQSKQLSE